MKDLLTIEQLGADGIAEVMALSDSFAEVCQRPVPKVPALRGKTVASMFFEDSTRTRTSFETAAKRLSADTMSFSASSSSVNKGESLRDTVETIEAMGVDALVVRHKSSGAPQQIAAWTTASVINAGDGWHAHPTQSLLDVYTIRAEGRGFEGLDVAIVGDIAHSRVARSNIEAFTALGCRVTLVAPPTLLPAYVEKMGVEVSHDLDAVLSSTDVLYLRWVILVSEHRIAGNYKQRAELREIRNDVVGDAITEILLLLVVTEVVKGQHGDGGFSRQRKRPVF